MTDVPIMLSVVVKCLNEEAHLERCLRSILAATEHLSTEIIVADSRSEDRTVEIAMQFPVQVVQLKNMKDRGCAAAAQLGYQFVRGRFLLLVDADMELLPAFIPEALAEFERDPRIATIGGYLQEMSQGLEFQERVRRFKASRDLGHAKRITGCGMYRVAALRQLGFFMNRNLASGEELELGARLRAHGWRLLALPLPSVRHYGHEDSPVGLFLRRWRSRYLLGHGQFLRAAWGQPWFGEAISAGSVYILVIAWWLVLALAILGIAFGVTPMAAAPVLLLAPFVIMWLRKRSLVRGNYAIIAWQIQAIGLIRGLLAPQTDPKEPIQAVVIRDQAKDYQRRPSIELGIHAGP